MKANKNYKYRFTLYYPVTDEGRHPELGAQAEILPVAHFATESVDLVFGASQHFDQGWVSGRESFVMPGLRSSCAGDLIGDNKTGKLYRLESFGFSEVDPAEYRIMRFCFGDNQMSGDAVIN